MEPYEVENNSIVCNIPMEDIKNTIKNESIVVHEIKHEKDENEVSSQVSRISLGGAQVGSLKKKLLVLDINGVLADILFPPPSDIKGEYAMIMRAALFKRPFCLEFLKFCFEKFEVAIWSSGKKESVEQTIDYLMGDMKKKLLFYWDYSHCTKTTLGINLEENKQKHLMFKDLSKIWENYDPNLPWEKGYYNESNTLLLDDSPYKAWLNPPHTSVFPHEFRYQNKSDNSLAIGGDLREYLDGLANSEDMAKYVEEHPFGQEGINEKSDSWYLYLNVIASNLF
ncbi:PREDICTED: ubiquitin-like domain-containing CTD phosphatase 1 [Lupinus angustifolius]|uniref:ubiquitin-like domain-containing CTD phosphatase 1 n=1 Tax=Lupinus angustifolius TaxID=3871 RepID=UPI00092E9F86|nr:PREDICTED: ubiquitin-like domain-containing CTD phosphatase 1 [Lupinus angustifolius]